MIPLPKPRGFWDYASFAFVMAGALVFVFWVEASNGVGWADAVLALAAAVLLVLSIILARRAEKAAWIVRPTRWVQPLIKLGILALLFGSIYEDAYILHRRDITADRIRHDAVIGIPLSIAILLPLRRRKIVGDQLP
jgi:hypothetical protein